MVARMPSRSGEPDQAEHGEVRAGFDAFYERKWSGHGGFWLDWYPRYMGLYADLLRQRNREISAALPNGLGRALDCGCGAGDVSAILIDRARAVVAVDVAIANLYQTRRNLRDQAAALCAGAEDLPFASEQFDAVVLADVIEHIPRNKEAMVEIARVLRPGGLLVIATPDRQVLETIEAIDRVAARGVRGLRSFVRRAMGRPGIGAHAPSDEAWEEFLTRQELADLVRGVGLTIREHRNICFYPGPEGGGVFAMMLATIGRFDRFRERLMEPALRPLFAAIARLERFNQKQLLVAVK